MAERKSGPVKPPVIDLKARDASQSGGKPARSRTASRSARPPRPADPPPGPPETTTPEAVAPEPAGTGPTESLQQTSPEPPVQQSKPDSTETAAPDAAPTEAPRPTPRSEPLPPRQAKLAMPWSAISLAALGGAILGTALTYALVGLVPLPTSTPPIADPSERLAALEASVTDIESQLTPLGAADADQRAAADTLRGELATQAATIAELTQRLGRVAQEAAETVDLTPINSQLAAFEDRLSAIGAGASSADAAALAESLTGIEGELAELRTQLDAMRAQSAIIDQLNSELASLRASVAAQNRTLAGATISPIVQLPLLVSGLESAFAAGRPYASELDALRTLLPELVIPAAVSEAAAAGLPRADRVAARFEAAVPQILAGRAAVTTGDLGQDALEWAKALLAIRPTGEMEGTSPDAIVSRLEAAVAREDFVAASELLASLPQPMRDAAGEVGTDIGRLAAASGFIADLRAQALAPVTGTTP